MRRDVLTIYCLLALLTGGRAPAQLPDVPLPQLPGVQVPALPDTTRAVDGTLRNLAGARALRIERLAREHRAELERDPRGELVVRAEVVAVDIGTEALARARAADFRVLRTRELPELAVTLTILQTPDGMSASRGLKKLRKLDPAGTYDFNHVYLDSAAEPTGAPAASPGAAPAASPGAAPAKMPAAGPAGARLGLIDSGVDAAHVALRSNVWQFFGCDGQRVPSAHGTSVASLLAGSADNFSGSAPRAEIFAADVYCGRAAGGAVDSVAAAFAWMARERVAVINVSLVGPRNALLERVVASLVNRGFLIVAAVGNDGPAAPPLYPAAYAGVLSVTAVDARRRVLVEACRGKHVDVAAPGADVTAAVAGKPEDFATVRGTSFAAPMIAGLAARSLREPDAVARDRMVEALLGAAIDLGPRGRDDIYGAGLVVADTSRFATK